MLRVFRSVLGLTAIFVATSGWEARSQYYPGGYGAYGFGGWGGGTSASGDTARGLGAYAAGAGAYNYQTAQANAINANTVMQYNQYLYASHLEAQRKWNAYNAKKLGMDNAHYNARLARIRENPTEEDITTGNALNAILDQLTDPKLSGSSLRLANDNVSPQLIKAVPFRDETDAITLSLDQMTDKNNWPLPLRSDVFAPERAAYEKAVDDALAEDIEGGTLKPETIARVRSTVAALYAKVDDTLTKPSPDHNTAMNYLKGLAGMSRMLEKPNVETVLAELDKVQTTSVGKLLSFMQAYNLRFDAAQTPKQKAAYMSLYPILAASREKVVGKGDPNLTATAPPPPAPSAAALFQGIDPAHLNAKPN
jgi:hypothetical protein